ncbi:hypothetical protein [Mycoplasmopsis felis]|uniref:hypothetical protein n=1 Tax=Mycoplasmopsis felis TaxID=33923 RepID=UPI002FEF6A63
MSRYTGPVFKKSRRLGFSILETGKEFSKGKKRTYAPGQRTVIKEQNYLIMDCTYMKNKKLNTYLV